MCEVCEQGGKSFDHLTKLVRYLEKFPQCNVGVCEECFSRRMLTQGLLLNLCEVSRHSFTQRSAPKKQSKMTMSGSGETETASIKRSATSDGVSTVVPSLQQNEVGKQSLKQGTGCVKHMDVSLKESSNTGYEHCKQKVPSRTVKKAVKGKRYPYGDKEEKQDSNEESQLFFKEKNSSSVKACTLL